MSMTASAENMARKNSMAGNDILKIDIRYFYLCMPWINDYFTYLKALI